MHGQLEFAAKSTNNRTSQQISISVYLHIFFMLVIGDVPFLGKWFEPEWSQSYFQLVVG